MFSTDLIVNSPKVSFSSSPAAGELVAGYAHPVDIPTFECLTRFDDSTILCHDSIAFLGDEAIRWLSQSISRICPPLQCIECGLASSRRQLGGPAGGFAGHVADPQLPLCAHPGNRVTACPTFTQPPIITVVMVSPSPARDSPRDYMPTADIPFVESANTPEDPWWDWQAEEDPRVQDRVWATIAALEDTVRAGRLVLKNGRHVTLARGLPRLVQKSPDELVPGLV
ncbi:hypothetical protein EDB85DRAFT_2148350 [Lactarius pseudohatsudake]|nr:hypothetical protein EDB85DRAFT_2148350 [Lactarius pseudohatsudake]